jgi:hypothetical protein
MDAARQSHVTFFLTGRRSGELGSLDGMASRPALMAGYRDLASLRYDFPMVLMPGRADQGWAVSLSALVDEALATAAHGAEGDRVRHHGLRVEREVRALVRAGVAGSLSACWSGAVERLMEAHPEHSFVDSIKRLRNAIRLEGDVVDCDQALPARAIRHAWTAVQARKAEALAGTIDRLVLKLRDILRADLEHSEEGRAASRLKASVGTAFGESFDFEQLSQVLGTAKSSVALPEIRRRRIQGLLDVLESQLFVPRSGPTAALQTFGFVFGSCSEALEAFKARMPRLIELARAMAIAELEADGQYREARHDVLFEHFGANGLDPRDLALYPDYLVITSATALRESEQSRLMEVLGSGLPFKVLLQIDDILEEAPLGNLTTGRLGRQTASMAMGLNEVYVLQAGASHLLQLREQVLRGLAYDGPALFSIFTGASGSVSGLAPYLASAAAVESRAFPIFVYDPAAGPDWASRFSLAGNPQVDLDWPIQPFVYEDEKHQRVAEDVAFTMVDFVASDRRYARHLARVPREEWHAGLIHVDEALTRERRDVPEAVPCVLMVDGDDRLHRMIADERLLREARRCREMWHSLQELGGIHNSHAEALLARELVASAARARQDGAPSPIVMSLDPLNGVPAPPVVAAAILEAAPARSPDEAYIETERCSSCNECTTINSRMFAYNPNKQAYIADLSAGSYAQLVEAAESCQVSVIHPGKPRNPSEPGLEELLKRAAAFT